MALAGLDNDGVVDFGGTGFLNGFVASKALVVVGDIVLGGDFADDCGGFFLCGLDAVGVGLRF